jgi:hypothetical protein
MPKEFMTSLKDNEKRYEIVRLIDIKYITPYDEVKIEQFNSY